MTPLNTSPIDLFAEKVKMAARSKSKDIRISLDDATELSAVMLQILSRQNQLLSQIADMSNQLQNQGPTTMSGGKL